MKLVSTSEKLVSKDYPYGFTLRTTKTDWIEFKKGKGFRHVSQTINPKTGRKKQLKLQLMYTYEQNPVLKNEISIYFNDELRASINKANFDSDKECTDFALFMVNAMNEKI